MDKATALLHASRGSQGDNSSLLTALRAALLGDGFATYAGNPNGFVTPTVKGESLFDTTNLVFYRATALTNTSWAAQAAGSVTGEEMLSLDVSATVELFDDFLGDVLADQWDTKIGTASTTGIIAITTGINGVVRIATGDSATTTDAVNGVQFQSALNYQANQGGLALEVRIKPGTLANHNIFVGFTDQTASLEWPLTINDGALTGSNTADDAVGFMFNALSTTPANTVWNVGGVKATTKTAVTALAIGPSDGTYQTLRIEISTAGAASFYINGTLQTTIPNAVTTTVPLTPVIRARSRTNASRFVDTDYIKIRQNR